MGFLKGAEYWALEAQTHRPYAPRILKRLAMCSIALNDMAVAEKYLTILNGSYIYRDWVQKIREEVYGQGPDHLKKRIFGERETDFDILYINNKNPNYNLIQILNKDPQNTMAFEYLMSYYLLSNEIGNFQYFLSEFGSYSKGTLPPLYQEALLLYMMTKQIPEEEMGYTIHQSVKSRMTAFNKILIEYKLDEKRARRDLQRLFGDTFWYYMRYVSPEATGSKLKRKSL
jgi:hypothetical protein